MFVGVRGECGHRGGGVNVVIAGAGESADAGWG